jgi:hypothetical protein
MVLVHWMESDEALAICLELVWATAVLNDVVAAWASGNAEELSGQAEALFGSAAAQELG